MNISETLQSLPSGLRRELIDTFINIQRNYREHRWEPSELNGGKFCEVVYTILKGYLDGSFPDKATKPPNVLAACQALEAYSSDFPKSVRVHIPRMLVALYDVRNHRGVGHVGGDVNPNAMDALCVLHISKWVLCELIRVFHTLTPEQATSVVETLSTRELPLVWQIGDRRRVLNPAMHIRDQALCLLYSSEEGLSEDELRTDLEHPNRSNFRRDVIRKLHNQREIEFHSKSGNCKISPTGARKVEEALIPKLEREI